MSSSIHNALTNKTCLAEHPKLSPYAMNGQEDGFATTLLNMATHYQGFATTLLNMATHYQQAKLVVDGGHTSASKQRAGESVSEYTLNGVTLCLPREYRLNWVTFSTTQKSLGRSIPIATSSRYLKIEHRVTPRSESS
jgi:hypothetical protein